MFQKVFEQYHWDEVEASIFSKKEIDVERALAKSSIDLEDFKALISPAAQAFLEPMAQKASLLTQQRFGKTIQMYVPLYLSNECQNICTYCGFSLDIDIQRKTLTDAEILQEVNAIKQMGFDHVLIVTGEAQKTVGMDYFIHALELIKPYFSSISMEVQPLEEEEYARLHQAGVYSILVYQETYHKETYKTHHPKGKKSNFDYRLATPDRACKAGIHKLGLGVLYGLEQWQPDTFFTALHLRYLEKTYWKSHYSISFPRLRPCANGIPLKSEIKERELVQVITAFRLLSPTVELSISTRESESFRNHVIPLGITSMSAASKTNPGGYAVDPQALEQFEISDERSIKEVKQMIEQQGYEAVFTNWSNAFSH
jgi:2-iminoacetate synthase